MKYLGLDFGTKRIGAAASDENGEFAFPKAILPNDYHVIDNLKNLIKEEQIQAIVLGESLATNELPNEVSEDIGELRKSLEALGLPIFMEREGHSSVEAYRYQQDKGPADDRAAAIILQRFLDKNKK